ncbi:conserved hypothetical protein [Neospora caninum Liverpool]|uniref:Uncharacterized protein n=1 Tax=Neospora caninum (strain Liverpool) TaxID=572307 RepID=F0VNN7_NEOCL|nr:conserved hypothetical protein [Neospora caninum Liverpool]CBZ55333.1 conserved hypothetical protein [Neospora caninum Liverpool]|eukprot:XP_003885361.1 conserved hypothetical protein [Neospora caninum Liverpool]
MAASRHSLLRGACAESRAANRRNLAHGAGDSVPESLSFSVLRKLCRTRKGLDRILQVYQTHQASSNSSLASSSSSYRPSPAYPFRNGDPGESLICSPDALAYVAHALCHAQLARSPSSSKSSSPCHSSSSKSFSPSYALKRAQLLRGRRTVGNPPAQGRQNEHNAAVTDEIDKASLAPHCYLPSQPSAPSFPSSSPSLSSSPAVSACPFSPSSRSSPSASSSACSSASSAASFFASSTTRSSTGKRSLVDTDETKEEKANASEDGGKETHQSEVRSREDERARELEVNASALFRLRGFSQASPAACLSSLATHFLVDHALILIDKDHSLERGAHLPLVPDSSSSPSSPPRSTSARHDSSPSLPPPSSDPPAASRPSRSGSSFSPANYAFLLFALSFSPSHSISGRAALGLLRPLPVLLPQFSLLDVSQAVAFMTQLPRLLEKETKRGVATASSLSLARGLRNQPTYRVAVSPGAPILTVLSSPSAASPPLTPTSSSSPSLACRPPAASYQASVSLSQRHKSGSSVSLDWFLSRVASRLYSYSSPLLPFDPTSPQAPVDALKHATLILSAFSSVHYALKPALLSLFLSSLFRTSSACHGAHADSSLLSLSTGGPCSSQPVLEPRALQASPQGGQDPQGIGSGEQDKLQPAERGGDLREAGEERKRPSSISQPASASGTTGKLERGAPEPSRHPASSPPSFPTPGTRSQVLRAPWRIAGETLPLPVAAKFFLALATQCAFQAHELVGKRHQVSHRSISPGDASSGFSTSPSVPQSSPSSLPAFALSSASCLSYAAPGSLSFCPPSSSSPPSSSPPPSSSSPPSSASSASPSYPSSFPPPSSCASPPFSSASVSLTSSSFSRPSGICYAHQCAESTPAFMESVAGGVAASLAASVEERCRLVRTPSQNRDISETQTQETSQVLLQMEAFMRHLLSSVTLEPVLGIDGEAMADCVEACAILDVALTALHGSVRSSVSSSSHERSFLQSPCGLVPGFVSSAEPPHSPAASPVLSGVMPSLPSSNDSIPSSPRVCPLALSSSSDASPSQSPSPSSLVEPRQGAEGSFSNACVPGEAPGGGLRHRQNEEECNAVWLERVREKLAEAGMLLSRNARPHRRQKRAFQSKTTESSRDGSEVPPSPSVSPPPSSPALVDSPLPSFRSAASPSACPSLPSVPLPHFESDSPCHRWPSFCFLPFLRGRVHLRLATTPGLLVSLFAAWAHDPRWSTSALVHLLLTASCLQSSPSSSGACWSPQSPSSVPSTQASGLPTQQARRKATERDNAKTAGATDEGAEEGVGAGQQRSLRDACVVPTHRGVRERSAETWKPVEAKDRCNEADEGDETLHSLDTQRAPLLRSGALVALFSHISHRLRGEDGDEPSKLQRQQCMRSGTGDDDFRERQRETVLREGKKTSDSPRPLMRLQCARGTHDSSASGCAVPRSSSGSSSSAPVSSAASSYAPMSPPRGKHGHKQKTAFVPTELGPLLLSMLCVRFTFHRLYPTSSSLLSSPSLSSVSALSSTSSGTASASSAASPSTLASSALAAFSASSPCVSAHSYPTHSFFTVGSTLFPRFSSALCVPPFPTSFSSPGSSCSLGGTSGFCGTVLFCDCRPFPRLLPWLLAFPFLLSHPFPFQRFAFVIGFYRSHSLHRPFHLLLSPLLPCRGNGTAWGQRLQSSARPHRWKGSSYLGFLRS